MWNFNFIKGNKRKNKISFYEKKNKRKKYFGRTEEKNRI